MSVVINARFVRQRMVDLDYDQKTVAKVSGLTEASISRLMNGGGFTSNTLGALAKALACNPVDLIQPAGFDTPLADAPVAVGQSA